MPQLTEAATQLVARHAKRQDAPTAAVFQEVGARGVHDIEVVGLHQRLSSVLTHQAGPLLLEVGEAELDRVAPYFFQASIGLLGRCTDHRLRGGAQRTRAHGAMEAGLASHPDGVERNEGLAQHVTPITELLTGGHGVGRPVLHGCTLMKMVRGEGVMSRKKRAAARSPSGDARLHESPSCRARAIKTPPAAHPNFGSGDCR